MNFTHFLVFLWVFALSFAMKRSAPEVENGEGNCAKRLRNVPQVQGGHTDKHEVEKENGGFQGELLPFELWRVIMNRSDGHGVRPLSAVSKRFHQTIKTDHILSEIFENSRESIAEKLLTASYKLNNKHTHLIEIVMPTFFKNEFVMIDEELEIIELVSVDAERISRLIMRCECLTAVETILDNINSRTILGNGEIVGNVIGNALLSEWNKIDANIPLTVDAFEVWATDEFIDSAKFETFIIPYLILTSSAVVSKRLVHTILRRFWLQALRRRWTSRQIVKICDCSKSVDLAGLHVAGPFFNKRVVEQIGKDLCLLCYITYDDTNSFHLMRDKISFFLKYSLGLDDDVDMHMLFNDSHAIFESDYTKMLSYLDMAIKWGFDLNKLLRTLIKRARQDSKKYSTNKDMVKLLRWIEDLSAGNADVEIDEENLDLAFAIMKQFSSKNEQKKFARNIWSSNANVSKLALKLIQSKPERFGFILGDFLKHHKLHLKRNRSLSTSGKFHEMFTDAANIELSFNLFKAFGWQKEFSLALAHDIFHLMGTDDAAETFSNVVKSPKLIQRISKYLNSHFKLEHVLILLDKIDAFTAKFPSIPLDIQTVQAKIRFQEFKLLLNTCMLIGGDVNVLRDAYNAIS